MNVTRKPPLLIVFTRLPEVGRVKTRMIPALGAEGAAGLHRRMAVHILMRARRAARQYGFSLEVLYDGDDAAGIKSWLGPDLNFERQIDGDLGRRMASAFDSAFSRGYPSAVLIGTDCPRIDEALLGRAFAALNAHDAVLGAATDGGYYLIGLRRSCPEIFNGISWGTGSVLGETLRIADVAGFDVGRVDTLPDVDRIEDLGIWEEARWDRPQCDRDTISVIIPALNEEGRIAQTLAHAAEAGTELIVVDGGSIDATRAIAQSHGARVIESARGRARQMNAGAAEANGSIVLFLHADTLLPAGYGEAVRHALSDHAVAGGAFRFELDEQTVGLRLITWGANFRARYLGMPYGDQALFLRAETLRRAGGFPDWPVMEDVALVRALKAHGRLRILDQPVVTSARRWRKLGALRVTFLHAAAITGITLGCSPQSIHAWLSRQGYDGCSRQDGADRFTAF